MGQSGKIEIQLAQIFFYYYYLFFYNYCFIIFFFRFTVYPVYSTVYRGDIELKFSIFSPFSKVNAALCQVTMEPTIIEIKDVLPKPHDGFILKFFFFNFFKYLCFFTYPSQVIGDMALYSQFFPIHKIDFFSSGYLAPHLIT